MLRLLGILSIFAVLSGCASYGTRAVGVSDQTEPSRGTVTFSSGLSIPVMTKVVAGNRFFYVRLRIGDGPETNVILDTGSNGLRAVSAVVPHSNTSGRKLVYSFESGSELQGTLANESLSAGGRSLGTVPVQVVNALLCTKNTPNCPVAQLDPATPFVKGVDGRSSEEFGAIMGIRLFDQAGKWVPNPLVAAGFERWVVQLPIADDQPGALILDPSMAELKGFTRLKVDKNGTVAGCLNVRGGAEITCSSTVLDSGDPHVFVFSRDVEQRVLTSGKAMALVLSDTGSADSKVIFKFLSEKVGAKGGHDVLLYRPEVVSTRPLKAAEAKPYINSGYLPFMHYNFLFDNEERVIGLQSRTGISTRP
ncbi:hypothetical protein NLK61_18985 [Pseudomonas fuscovaginae UPB0736]|uniref:hypothetical protein n=1 Tax=Pseudomonas asplenii TaxID=53407 RepID=UPI0002897192|nr:hypothetical protein [Pseudomonas fuscovaginae]UUQ63349.1 hypothetical protein NLK61_18985 [Pseudomonas fuscovaginae UPB0736]